MNWFALIFLGLVAILGAYEIYALVRDIKARKNKSAVKTDDLKGVKE